MDAHYYFMKIRDQKNDTVQIKVCLKVTFFKPASIMG